MNDDLKLRAEVAVEIFGWTGLYTQQGHSDQFLIGQPPPPASVTRYAPKWETSLDACREVLREVERRGLLPELASRIPVTEEYDRTKGTCLYGVCVGLTATPADICRAALATVRQSAESPTQRSS